jgi:hypothetical protein
MMLELGDIAFFKGQSWLSGAIRKFSRTKGEGPTLANHVGLIVVEGTDRTALVVEALSKVKLQHLWPAHEHDELAVIRPLNVSEAKRKMMGLQALRYVNRRYGYLKIVLHAMDRLLGGRYFFRRLGRIRKYPICSYLVADAYAAIGLDFGVPVGQAQPDDIWDFAMSNPDKYKIIRNFRPI